MQPPAKRSLPYSLDLEALKAAYASHALTARGVVSDVLTRIQADRAKHAWIQVFPRDALLARAAELERQRARGEHLPLYGVPFAAKDNIDVRGEPTTAACPAYAYVASESADVVLRLERAGAICIGKTNLDQFATGLVGTRSPYGACANPFNADYISGGSSSGSAVAVALGHVSFALGTDTAGSGRVPAAFCNVVGLKPTRGLISTRGVVPACRSLDCVSVFALTVNDASSVVEIAALAPDDADARAPSLGGRHAIGTPLRCGVLRAADLQFFGDGAAERAYAHARERLASLGADLVEIEYEPFGEAGRLLYEGPWLAERLAAIQSFYERSSDEMNPVVRDIIGGGRKFTGADVFEGQHQLRLLEQRCADVWKRVDVLVVPTAGTIYRMDEVAADPIRLNSNLGRYTNFVNLLDLAAIAVPAGFRDDGLPFGLTFIAPAFEDARLAHWAARFWERSATTLGATGWRLQRRHRELQHAASVEQPEGRQ